MTISGFDHAAIPIDGADAMLHFYASLGFEVRLQCPAVANLLEFIIYPSAE